MKNDDDKKIRKHIISSLAKFPDIQAASKNNANRSDGPYTSVPEVIKDLKP